MDAHAKSTYLREVATQSQFALNAAANLNHALNEIRTKGKETDLHQRTAMQSEVFRSIHSLLTHASNISRMFWPPRPSKVKAEGQGAGPEDFSERGATLRAAVGLPDDGHPLKSRRLRDHLEHFDERLDDWVNTSHARNYAQDTIAPWGSISGIAESDVMRWYDQQSRRFIFRGESLDVQELVTAIGKLLPVARAASEKFWSEGASSHARRIASEAGAQPERARVHREAERSDKWPQAARLLHLRGGLRAVNNPGPEVLISAGAGSPVLTTLSLTTYGGIYTDLTREGLAPLGAQFYQHKDELVGLVEPEWRPIHGAGWLHNDVWTTWRQIGHAATDLPTFELADLAFRVAFSLRATAARLMALSKTYEAQLKVLALKNSLRDYQRFEDLRSFAIYMEIHGCLVELGTLRDYLAEAAACFLKIGPVNGAEKINSMSGLRGVIRQTSTPPTDSLLRHIKEATDREPSEGWLSVLSAYRNLVVHAIPIKYVNGVGWIIQKMIETTSGSKLPVIYCPLPSDPTGLGQQIKRGGRFADYAEWLAAAAKHADESREPDALLYLHNSLGKLVVLAKLVADRSPVAPRPIELKEEDLVGPMKITKGPL